MLKPVHFIGAGVVAVALGVLGWTFLAPESATEAEPITVSGTQTSLLVGQFEGADATHHASGTVTVVSTPSGNYLQLSDYDALQGPDVYFFGTTAASGAYDDTAIQIPVPGGAGAGEATVRGSFTVPLPASIMPSELTAVVIWCERFGVEFGAARLRPVASS